MADPDDGASEPEPEPESESGRELDSDPESEPSFELERATDRTALGAVFRSLATAFENGTPVRIAGDEGTATVAVPPRVLVELEAEREDDDPPVAGLEIELEWDDPDGSSIRLDADARDEDGVLVFDADGEGGSVDPAPDAAMAAMPAESVTRSKTGDRPQSGDTATAGTDESDPSTDERVGGRTSRFEVYQDRADEWRWRLVHWNGNIVADSGEGYASRSNAKRAVRSVMRTVPTARLVDRDDREGDSSTDTDDWDEQDE